MTKRHLVIATRESPLALRQAEMIKSLLNQYHPHLEIEFLGITTQADKMLDINLTEVGGKGLFVKELEEALFDGRADIAVHSMKDVPMELPSGLILPVIGKREDPRDVFISNKYDSIQAMAEGAILGSSSNRRKTQMMSLRPDIQLKNLRGNIQTRLRKLDESEYDAIILAAAGLIRMQLQHRITHYISTNESLPAAGQGALGIECRADDVETQALIGPINDTITHACVTAERAMCRGLGGGCEKPVAAFAEIHAGILTLKGFVSSLDGKRVLRSELQGDPNLANQLGEQMAEELLLQGAQALLEG